MIFVDTSFFYALASANDHDHERVREVFESFGNRRLNDFLLTTNHAVFETIRLTRRRRGHSAAVEMVWSAKKKIATRCDRTAGQMLVKSISRRR